MLVTEVGSYEDGSVRLSSDALNVSINAHWPFDRSTDEWIDVCVQFPIQSLRTSMSDDQRQIFAEASGDMAKFATSGDDSMLMTLVGRNTLGPVELEIRLSPTYASEIAAHLQQLAI